MAHGKVYRVTAWDPKTNREYNVGLFIAKNRDAAMRKARSKRSRNMVLDAYEIKGRRNPLPHLR